MKLRPYSLLIPLFLVLFAKTESANASEKSKAGAAIFRFNLSTEPSHADPARINSSESNYFLMNVHRGLYVLSKSGTPEPEIAESCRPLTSKVFRCAIKKSAKWSDGSSITAQDFVDSWRRLAGKNAKGVGIQIIANVKGALQAHNGALDPGAIGIKALDDRRLEIELENEDSDFLSKLAHPALAVTRTGFELHREAFKTSKAVPVSGPYFIKDWSRPDRIRLSPNPYYAGLRTKPRSNGVAPEVEVLIVDDDETALNLYREGTLSFLRRLPTHYLKAWKNSPELHQIPVIRFDYIGFGGDLKSQEHLRRALAKSLRYDELQVLYSALGTPGCPGLMREWMTSVPCHTFDVNLAKKELAKSNVDISKQRLELAFSKLGGDDIQKGMEWAQAQWKSHLGIRVDLAPTEQGVYVNRLRTSPPAIFRKGVGLDRASCLAALEIFSKGDAENYIRFENQTYETIIQKLKKEINPRSLNAKKLCSQGIQILIDQAVIIPLGPIHFSILAKPQFQDWTLTPLNQLDLGQLRTHESGSF